MPQSYCHKHEGSPCPDTYRKQHEAMWKELFAKHTGTSSRAKLRLVPCGETTIPLYLDPGHNFPQVQLSVLPKQFANLLLRDFSIYQSSMPSHSLSHLVIDLEVAVEGIVFCSNI